MANDFLDQLSDLEVPPPPAEFGKQLHDRVNHWLVIAHLVELACGAFPLAVMELGRALCGLVRFTLTGKYENSERKRFDQ